MRSLSAEQLRVMTFEEVKAFMKPETTERMRMSDSKEWLKRRRETLETAEEALEQATKLLSSSSGSQKLAGDLVELQGALHDELDSVYAKLARSERAR